MASEKQVAANRRNATKSSGPRTKSGKARSSRNALNHGLSAEQVVIFDEDPAAFEALRGDLYAHFQPSDPVDEALVEQVAACRWRLRRVPEIEAGIFEHYLHHHSECRARMRKYDDIGNVEEMQAKDRQEEPRAVLGKVFSSAERSLGSLTRIAGAIESSMYRAIRELERMNAERHDATTDDAVIDVEADEVEPAKPLLIQS